MKPAVRSDLATCDVRDEVVVYDFRNNQARCLNQTAAKVFKLCDGTRSPRQIAAALACDEELVWLALGQLDDGALLDPPLGKRAVDLDRRRLLKKMALTAGLSVALPAVWSIVAPTPAYAASGGTVACTPASDCMSSSDPGCCNNGGRAFACTGAGASMCMGVNATCDGMTLCR
jgi:hypothetical protein